MAYNIGERWSGPPSKMYPVLRDLVEISTRERGTPTNGLRGPHHRDHPVVLQIDLHRERVVGKIRGYRPDASSPHSRILIEVDERQRPRQIPFEDILAFSMVA